MRFEAKRSRLRQVSLLARVIGVAVCVGGCATKTHYVVAATGTVIGVEIDQDQVTQTPQAKLGYNRGELAIVPTDRQICSIPETKDEVVCAPGGGTAEAVPDVLMELKYAGIFDVGQASGIYQRLAVGDTAVRQPGAAAMFIRNSSGDVDANTAAALVALGKIPVTGSAPEASKSALIQAFNGAREDPVKKAVFDEAARQAGFESFVDFGSSAATQAQVKIVADHLAAAGIAAS